MNSKKFQVLMSFIFVIFGILITIQIKSIQKEFIISNRQKNINDLNSLLTQEKQKVALLEEKLNNYEYKVNEYEDVFLEGSKSLLLKKQLDYSRLVGGLTDVTGTGVTITLDDSVMRNAQNINPRDTIIHDYQLLEIINLLKARGAEALSLNGERIVTTSEIQCAGPTVSINGTRYSVPFVIDAIGNADYLEASLKEPGSILNLMQIYGIQINVKKEQTISIPKYKYYYRNANIISELGVKE